LENLLEAQNGNKQMQPSPPSGRFEMVNHSERAG
jgi:hypothetical protein